MHWHASYGTLGNIESLKGSNIVDMHINDLPAGISFEEQVDNRGMLPGETGGINCRGFYQL
ncbi:MAG: hypothetical protein QW797_03265 [Thermoproteota archaeon]